MLSTWIIYDALFFSTEYIFLCFEANLNFYFLGGQYWLLVDTVYFQSVCYSICAYLLKVRLVAKKSLFSAFC